MGSPCFKAAIGWAMKHGPNLGGAGTPKRRRPGSDDDVETSSSGYSRSSPPRRWHRPYGHSYSSSSSSDYYSSSPSEGEDDSRLGIILGDGPAERRAPNSKGPHQHVFGRKLNREGRDWPILGKNCQFVKKVIQDPGLHDPNSRERPTFVTATDLEEGAIPAAGARMNTLSASERSNDPRLRLGAQYFEACRRAQTRQTLRIPFVWEESTSRGPPPPCTVLLTGFPSTVISKSLLISLLESSLGWSIQELVKEVQLAAGVASLTLKDPQGSSRLVNYLARHLPPTTSLGGGGIVWGAKFDRGGDEFRRQTAPKPAAIKMDPRPPNAQPRDDRPHGHHHNPGKALRPRDGLACDPRVPCVIVGYSELPPETRALRLQEAFGHHRLYNVERGREGWHVHLLERRHVDRIREHPSRVLMDGVSPLSFSIRLFSPPDRALPRSEWEGRRNNVATAVRRDRQPEPLLSHSTPRTVSPATDIAPATNISARYTRSDSRLDLGNFYRPSEGLLSTTLEGAVALPPVTAADQVGFEAISDLPSFNRRLLERQRMEEEQAAVAAETARLALEARLEAEAARQAQRQEKELRRQQRLARKQQRQQEPASKGGETFTATTLTPPLPRLHKSGCARAEGYYAQEPLTKTVFIEDLTRPSVAPGPYQSDVPNAGLLATGTSAAPPPLHPSSRSNRAQNRRLQSSRDSIASDLLGKSGAFAAREKRLLLGRSSIHSWGLFAGEDIEAGDMVVEYVGEVIRHSVANVRERRYELALRARGSSDIASSYLFRLSAESVIDATHKGNISRFINHSCDPTCMARILDGRRIIMYARRDIQRGEEITYDYKFPHEDDPDKKIKCLCGARQCRGYLN